MKPPFHHFNAIDSAIKGKVTIYTVVSHKEKGNPRAQRFITRVRDTAFAEAKKNEKAGFYRVEIFAKAY